MAVRLKRKMARLRKAATGTRTVGWLPLRVQGGRIVRVVLSASHLVLPKKNAT
jgi:hypothetical protein